MHMLSRLLMRRRGDRPFPFGLHLLLCSLAFIVAGIVGLKLASSP